MTVSPEALAAETLAALNISEPPVNAVRVALAVGIGKISIRDDVVEHGRLLIDGSGVPQIVLQGDPTHDTLRPRHLFTLAHEIGHHLLDRRALVPLERQVLDPVIERYCDRFASALLMPPPWVRRWRHEPQTIETLRRFARQTGTSPEASIVALNTCAGWASGMLRFERRAGRWRLRSATLPPATRRRLNSTPATSEALDLARQGMHLLPLALDGEPVEVDADVELGPTVLALINSRPLLHPRAGSPIATRTVPPST